MAPRHRGLGHAEPGFPARRGHGSEGIVEHLARPCRELVVHHHHSKDLARFGVHLRVDGVQLADVDGHGEPPVGRRAAMVARSADRRADGCRVGKRRQVATPTSSANQAPTREPFRRPRGQIKPLNSGHGPDLVLVPPSLTRRIITGWNTARVPPCLDVYVLTQHRDRERIDRFMARYVDLDRSRDHVGEELMVLPLGCQKAEGSLSLARWDWVQATTLGEIIEFGLAEPCRAFRAYLHSLAPWGRAILGFTTDCRLTVGVSVHDPLNLPEPCAEASKLMMDLIELVEGERGWVVAEVAPPVEPERDRPWEQSWVVDRWGG